jgi:hypothetical protein
MSDGSSGRGSCWGSSSWHSWPAGLPAQLLARPAASSPPGGAGPPPVVSACHRGHRCSVRLPHGAYPLATEVAPVWLTLGGGASRPGSVRLATEPVAVPVEAMRIRADDPYGRAEVAAVDVRREWRHTGAGVVGIARGRWRWWRWRRGWWWRRRWRRRWGLDRRWRRRGRRSRQGCRGPWQHVGDVGGRCRGRGGGRFGFLATTGHQEDECGHRQPMHESDATPGSSERPG